MAYDIDTVFRDNKVKGDIHSGAHWPDKPEIRGLLKQIQSGGGQSVARNTIAALNAVTPPNEDYMGIVLTGATAGLYSREAGAWVFGRGFPDTFAKVALSGSGTAQTGVVNAGVNPASTEVFFAKVVTPNIGPLTLSVGGESARQVVNLAGNPLSAGEWAGMVMFCLNDGDQYQLLIDVGAAAAAAQSATDANEDRIAAEQALADLTEKYLGAFADDAAANAAAGGLPITGAEYWNTTDGKRKTWDGAAWQVNDIALDDGDVTRTKVAGLLSTSISYSAIERGAVGDGVANDAAAIDAAQALGALYFTPGDYRIEADLELTACATFEEGAQITVADGVTLTLSGEILAGAYKIFEVEGAGDIVA
ncbi:hypothetical protein [Devosia sp. A369]